MLISSGFSTGARKVIAVSERSPSWRCARAAHPRELSDVLPVLFLANWLWSAGTTSFEPLVPYAVATVIYLTIDLWINSALHRLAGSLHDRVHVFTNALDYLDALYVGRRDPLNYAVMRLACGILIRGNARVKSRPAGCCWRSRRFCSSTGEHVTLSLSTAIGFSMLLAEAVIQLDRHVASGFSRTTGRLAISRWSSLQSLFALAYSRTATCVTRDAHAGVSRVPRALQGDPR